MIYAYLRVSTAQQDEDNQRLGIEHKAKALNLCIDKTYIDRISGTTEPDKRQLGRLLRRVHTGDVIIVSEISRLSRRLFVLFRVLEELLSKGVKIYSVKDNYTLDDSIQSKVLAFAFGMAAEIERNLIAMRTREALELRKQMGIKLGRPVGSKTKVPKLEKHKDRIARMLKRGYSKAKIARKVKCTDKTLRKYLDIWGMVSRPAPKPTQPLLLLPYFP